MFKWEGGLASIVHASRTTWCRAHLRWKMEVQGPRDASAVAPSLISMCCIDIQFYQ